MKFPKFWLLPVLVVINAIGLFAQRTPVWQLLIDEARELFAEDSIALAIEKYQAALDAAPAEADLIPLRIALVRSQAREAEQIRDWEIRQQQFDYLSATLTSLRNQFPSAGEISPREMELIETQIELDEVMRPWIQPPVVLETAARLANQTDTAANVIRLVEFLQQRFTFEDPRPFVPREFRAFLEAIRDRAPDPDSRAWAGFALTQIADQANQLTPDIIRNWQSARELAHETRYAPLVEAGWFLWRMQHSWSAEQELGAAVDVPALMAEATALREAIEASDVQIHRYPYIGKLNQHVANWQQPVLQLEVASHYHPDLPVEFSFATAGLTDVTFELYRFPLHETQAWRNSQLPPHRDQARLQVGTWSLSFDDANTYSWHSDVHQFSPAPGPGFYLLNATGTFAGTKLVTQVLKRFTVGAVQAAMVIHQHPSNPHEVIITDAETGSPRANAQVSGITIADERVAWTTSTDENGRALGLRLPVQGNQFGRVQILGEADGQPFVASDHLRREPKPLVAELILDRPLYRPGETIHWKVIMRERYDAAWRMPAERTWSGSFTDQNDNTLLTFNDVKLDAFGSFHGEIQLPADLKPSTLDFSISASSIDEVNLGDVCTIDNFVPPALTATIEFAGSPANLRPGQVLLAQVTVSYFSGGPAVGTKVDLTVLEKPVSFDRYADRAPQKIEPLKLSATTNAQGVAEFRWRSTTSADSEATVVVNAEVLPVGGQPISMMSHWRATSSGLLVKFEDFDTPQLVRPEAPVEFHGRITNGAEQPASFQGIAEFVAMHWSAAYLTETGEIVNNYPSSLSTPYRNLPFGWKVLHEGFVEKVIETQSVETTPDGAFRAIFSPPVAGLYGVRLSDRDNRIIPTATEDDPYRSWHLQTYPMSRSYQLIAADESTTSLALPQNTNLLMTPPRVRPGAPLRALLVSPSPERPALVSVVREQASSSFVIPAGPSVRWVNLDSHTLPTGTMELMVNDFRGTTLGPSRVEIAPDSTPLQVTITAPADVRPGDRTPVTIVATQADGAPAQVQVSFAAADQAVVNLVEEDESATESTFRSAAGFVGASIVMSARPTSPEFIPLVDKRAGTVVRARGGMRSPTGDSDEDTILLSPFSVETRSGSGYLATTTLAGGRSAETELMDGGLLGLVQYSPDPIGKESESGKKELSAPAHAAEPTLRIRKRFASTAAWAPALLTDETGTARTEIAFPDNLTAWRLHAYAIGENGNTFATTTSKIRSDLPFQTRLQTPRFLVAGDTTSPSLVLVNRTAAPVGADATLTLEGPGNLSPEPPPSTTVPGNGEARVSWTLKADRVGQIALTGTARTTAEADGEQRTVPVIEDGVIQALAASTRLRSDQRRTTFKLTLPDPLDPDRTIATLQLATSPAIAALDALPYLIDYPYGCVEQTMSRFLPAIVVRDALTRLGLDPIEIENRILQTESGVDTRRRQRTAGLSKLDEVTQDALARLSAAQTYEGGFGWWPGADYDDPWMTAYVAWGLSLAVQAGVEISPALIDPAIEQCSDFANDRKLSPDLRAWALAACASHPAMLAATNEATVLTDLFAVRSKLTPSGRAALALATARFGSDEQKALIIRNLANQTVREKGDSGTLVHWGETRGHWNALDSANEATALSLLALFELAPDHELIEPAVAWLALNRRSAHWDSTRDTTFAVLALTRHLELSTQDAAPTSVKVELNGRLLATVDLSSDHLLEQPFTINLPNENLKPDTNPLSLSRTTRTGTTPVYITALAEAWATGNAVKPAHHLIDVSRQFERLRSIATVLGPLRITPELQPVLGSVSTGEQVNARLTINVPHEMHYVMVKVPKPAGCEPLNPLSGWDTTLTRPTDETATETTSFPVSEQRLYREEHDDHSAFFIDHLKPGMWQINFPLRAVTPGNYRALPASIEAMYVPEVRANTDARRLSIE